MNNRVIARIRLEDGTECDVLMVGIGQQFVGSCAAPEFVALVRFDDGTLHTRLLEGAVEIERPVRMVPIGREP